MIFKVICLYILTLICCKCVKFTDIYFHPGVTSPLYVNVWS